MSERILSWLFGIDSSSWMERGNWRLEWLAQPSGEAALLIGLGFAVAIAGLVFLYRWEAGHVLSSRRRAMIGLRLLALVTVLAILFEPVVVLSTREEVPSHQIVLLDNSQSMGLRDTWKETNEAAMIAAKLELPGGADGVRQRSRLELATQLLRHDLIERLESQGDRIVHLHTFAEQFNNDTEKSIAATPEDSTEIIAQGETTALGTALRQAILAYRGLPISGIVVISDGQSNVGEAVSSAAQMAVDERIPIATVTMGTTEGPRNARVSEVQTNPVAFIKDANRLTVSLESRGMDGAPATLLVEKRRDGGAWEEIAQQEVVLNLDGQLQTFPFEFSEENPCRLEFRAQLNNVGAEMTQDDNVATAEVRIIRQKLKALFIAGATFPEVQFLRNSLIRDRSIDLSTWLMAADAAYEHPGDVPIERLPQTRDELNEYDCVILYDPDPARWPENFPELLTGFVARAGGGLIYIAGEMHTSGLFDRQSDPALSWMSLLPVIREPGLFRSQVLMKLSAEAPWRMQLTSNGVRDALFQFSEEAQKNQQIIESLPGMYWHFPVTRAKPGATVLAVHGDPRMRNEFGPEVLLATQFVGPGRTIFVGFDSTYRWRYLDDQYFDGFWARMVDRAGRSKQLGGVYPFRLTTDQTQYQPGQQVRIVARFNDPTMIEPGMTQLQGELDYGDEAPIPIVLQPGSQEGEFETTFTVAQAGPHFVRVWLGDETQSAQVQAATLTIDVALPNLEFANPTLNQAILESLATQTGGKMYPLLRSDEVENAFSIRKVTRVLEERQEIWNAPLLYGLFLFAILAEWLLRKRHRLI
ncbi:MAG: VWA domain-containing protein [Planctomycetaceae bacterium]